MSVIQPDVRLHDARGGVWRTAPEFQDREVGAPGWLLMQRTSDGVEMPYHRVLAVFGYGPPEERYLLGRYDRHARFADDPFRCICDPADPFEPPDATPRAVEGCPAHKARRSAQLFAEAQQNREMQQSMNADGEL